ncbi:ester cyclase [Methylovirgula sp. 4M-Z18]|uniref:ester cyclase n=1 Tax=Methylovirgula sp. 4M-Z18 TaxID=2293567 RepID=UPI000E2FB1D2|nr:ester cyclase [Methylovirgula sp. 4M-Z18]RFB78820.1 ester cyclase [Methylovirgula sp. 4M-Z18]
MQNRRRLLTQGALAAGALIAPTLVSAQEKADGKAVAERFAASLNAHDINAFGALFADTYVNHQTSAAAPVPKEKTAKEATVAYFAARLAGIPNLAVTIEVLVANGDSVAASFVYTGKHEGPYFGVAPTGRELKFTSCDIFRVANGQIVEHWGMGDIAGILAQLKA